MKNMWKKWMAAAGLSVLMVAGAEAAVKVYADEIPNNSAPANTNAPQVKIDETGIHIGGPNPVEIRGPRTEGAMKAMVAILAIIGTFSVPIVIIVISVTAGYRRKKLEHETLRLMIEKGTPITPELVAEIRSGGQGSSGGLPRRRLLPGLVMTGVGTA